jgi:ribosome-associated toxin RatA of RatAB toxin-antitoxin module
MEFEIILSANKNKLFSIATDFLTYKKLLPDNILDIKVIQKNENETITEETLLFASVIKKEITQQSLHKILDENIVDSEVISGPLKGSVVHAQFVENTEGTKISVSFNLKIALKYKILSPLINKYYKIILRALFYKMNNMVMKNTE